MVKSKHISEHIIGIDIGTTSAKAVLFTAAGKVVGEHSIGYSLLSPQPEIQEQDPDEIYRAVIGSVREVVKRGLKQADSLIGLSFSSAMHSLIAADCQNRPLTNSITWADRRSIRWVKYLQQQCDAHALYTRTGTPIHPMSPLLKLIWLRKERSEIFEQAAKFISIKEYVIYRWFQQYVVDYSIANATGLFNMKTLDWDKEALALAGVTPAQLSQIVPTTHTIVGVNSAADEMGISANLPVVIGSSDGVLANLGVGAIDTSTVAVTVGTSGAIRAMVDKPKTDEQERLFCYALSEDRWLVGGAINNGGIVLRWVRDNLADSEVATARLLKKDAYDILTEIASTVPAGSEGLIFHPYLAGERAPLWDANARGSFFGLSLNHTKPHLVRAVLEGIVYNLYSVSVTLQELVGPATNIRATGGFARSPLWRQMLADVFNQTVLFPESTQGSSFGAAALGLYALGRISSLDEVPKMIGNTHSHEPIAENVERYKVVLPLYMQLIDKFAPLYGEIASDVAKAQTD
ncbi:MAG: gluconokinase [Cyanobacteria bacterium P01_D01_bin.1]